MPKIFTTLDKIKPAYDITYKVVLFICKLLLIADKQDHFVGDVVRRLDLIQSGKDFRHMNSSI